MVDIVYLSMCRCIYLCAPIPCIYNKHTGFAVIMNNGHDGDASHCCVGTGKGKVSCHNPGHKDVPPSTTWYSGGGINAIYGWADDINLEANDIV